MGLDGHSLALVCYGTAAVQQLARDTSSARPHCSEGIVLRAAMEINAVSSRGPGCTPICMQQDDTCTGGAGWLNLPQNLAVGLRLLKHVF